MKRKKLVALLTSAVVAVLLVGGTLAYFSSTDQEENRFSTAGEYDDNGSDIDIKEYFDNKTVEPGSTNDKIVQVQNIDKYNQLIKVKFDVHFLDNNGDVLKDEEGKEAKEVNGVTLDELKTKLKLNLANLYNEAAGEGQVGKWYTDCNDLTNNTAKLDANYYYLSAVPGSGYTTKILDSVTLDVNADNKYQGIKYEVKVVADGIQASNNAYREAGWTTKDTKLDSYLQYAAANAKDAGLDSEISSHKAPV